MGLMKLERKLIAKASHWLLLEAMACLWQRVGFGCRVFMTAKSEGKPSLPKALERGIKQKEPMACLWQSGIKQRNRWLAFGRIGWDLIYSSLYQNLLQSKKQKGYIYGSN